MVEFGSQSVLSTISCECELGWAPTRIQWRHLVVTGGESTSDIEPGLSHRRDGWKVQQEMLDLWLIRDLVSRLKSKQNASLSAKFVEQITRTGKGRLREG